MSDLSTHAIVLGQLGLRACRTYDLVKEMRRNLHFFWPRAESRIYATLKKLDDAGLVSADTVHTGARSASIWEITPSGQDAFRQWLSEDPLPTRLDCEALVRIFLAPAADHPAVRSSVNTLREEARSLLRVAMGIADEYEEGRAPFQDQVRVRALVFDFLASWAEMRVAWAARAEQLLDELDGLTPEEARQRALQHIQERRDALGLE